MSKPNQVTINCNYCGKEYSIKESQYKKSKSHYCSIECKSLAQNQKIITNCDNCGKEIIQKRSQYNRAKHHYCNNQCQKEYQHKERFEKRECIICNKEFEVSKTSKQLLCSSECQKEWQKLQIGLLNPRYTRLPVRCENCGKEYYVKKYKTENGQHLLCSKQCRVQWYSEQWSQQEEWKYQSRMRAVQILENRYIDTNTKPQRITNSILDELDVDYKNEMNFGFYSADNYLLNENLIIEVMGDYWHSNPIIYEERNLLNDVQSKRITQDKAKHTYIKRFYDIEILYLWEKDLYDRPDLCKRLIEEYIINHGELNNYHSFNYKLNGEEIILNQEIIHAYFDENESIKNP